MPTLNPPPRSVAVRGARAGWASRRFEAALTKVVEQYTKRVCEEETGGEDDAKKGG